MLDLLFSTALLVAAGHPAGRRGPVRGVLAHAAASSAWIALSASSLMLARIAGPAGQVNAEGILTKQFGSWAPPFGISFVADQFSAAMVVISSLLALAAGVFGIADLTPAQERAGFLSAVPGPDGRRQRRLPDRRHLQPLCLVRGDADRHARACSRSTSQGAARRRDQICRAEPVLDHPVPDGGRAALRRRPARSTWPISRSSCRRPSPRPR